MTINPQMITLAREASGKTQASLAHSIGVSQALLSRIEHGFDEPTERTLEAIATVLEVPKEFFSLHETILGEGVIDLFHRKRLTLPAKPLKHANAKANLIRLEVLRLLNSVTLSGIEPFPEYPLEDYGTPVDIARLVRATWRVPAGPLPDLVALIEATGTPVTKTDLSHEKLSAISMPGFAGRSVIVLNERMPASQQRFTLAHELGHLVMHHGLASEDLERDADLFAAELLMPANEIRRHLHNLQFSQLGSLKPIWRVSLAALIRTAYNLEEITERQYRYLYVKLNQLPGGRKNEPGEFPAEEPRLLRSVIEHFRTEVGYSVSDIAKLMVCTEERFKRQYLGERTVTLRSVGRSNTPVYRFPARPD